MAKVKYIPCDIYKRGISVFIGTLDEFKTWVKRNMLTRKIKALSEWFLVLKGAEWLLSTTTTWTGKVLC